MRAGALAGLAGQNLRADRKGAILNGAATCVGVAALVFFVSLGLGVGAAARRLFPGDARIVDVVPATVSLSGFLGGGALDDAAVERLRAIPGVEKAWRKLDLKVAVSATRPPERLAIGWPQGLVVQIPLVGVDQDLLDADAHEGVEFKDKGWNEPVPVVASKRLLEIYNKTLAPSWRMPRLPPGLSLVGAQLFVEIGRSFVPGGSEQEPRGSRLELAGLSDRVPIYTLAMPLESAKRIHAAFGKPADSYSAVALLAAQPDDVPEIAAAVRRMGFSVDEGERAIAERVGLVVKVTTGALTLLALLMCALAALAIGQSLSASVRARGREIAILRALGATPGDVRALVLVEAAAVGLFGGAAGVGLARLAALLADRLAAGALPDFPFRPDTFFAFAPWVPALGLAVAALAAIAGALGPAALAARLDPARSIS